MVKSGLLQSRGLDIVECDVDGKLYGWTKGDMFDLMSERDGNLDDRYGIVDIKRVEWTFTNSRRSTDGDFTASWRTFRIYFDMIKVGYPSVSKLTHMDIDDVVVKMRDLKLGKVLSNQDV